MCNNRRTKQVTNRGNTTGMWEENKNITAVLHQIIQNEEQIVSTFMAYHDSFLRETSEQTILRYPKSWKITLLVTFPSTTRH